ncbi:MAG: hypothetical protein QXU17_02750 [Archaeoglobaceae archaeon]
MISAIVFIVIGINMSLKVPFLAPMVYILRFWKKDAFVVAFLFYSILLCYEFNFENIYLLNISTMSLLFANLLLLDEGLKESSFKIPDYVIAVSMFLGLLYKDVLLFLILFTLFYRFYTDKPKKGLLILFFPAILLILFTAFSSEINHLGSTTTQAMVISALTAIICLLLIRKS